MQMIGTTAGGTVIVEMTEHDYEILRAMVDIAALAINLTKSKTPTTMEPAQVPAPAPLLPPKCSGRSGNGKSGKKRNAVLRTASTTRKKPAPQCAPRSTGGVCKFCGAKVRRKDMIACLKPACQKKGKAERNRNYRKNKSRNAVQRTATTTETPAAPVNRASPFVSQAQREQMIRDSVARADLKLCHDT